MDPAPIAVATDEALAARLIAGHREAFEPLVRRWRDRIVDLAWLLTGDRDAAEDIGQEAFLRFFRRPQAYDPARPFGAWICAVARNLCHDRFRRESTRTRHTMAAFENGRVGPRTPPAPPAAAVAAELEDRLRSAIAGLPARFREAYVLCAVRGLSYEEAAGICRCPPKTISTRLARARKRLLKRMGGW
jgi:RNA polymerase sigma-70 factor (ECF subfamily)